MENTVCVHLHEALIKRRVVVDLEMWISVDECLAGRNTYAGDCVDNLQLYLNQDLENVLNWLRANKLTLNMTQTEFMLIGSGLRLSTLAVSPTITIYDNEVS